jgi:hypothetical protein
MFDEALRDIFQDYLDRFGPTAPGARADAESFEEDGVLYDVLTNINGVLAVYGPDGKFIDPEAWPAVLQNW